MAAAITFVAASPNVTFAKHDAAHVEVSKTFVVASVNVIAPVSDYVFINEPSTVNHYLTLAAVKSHECRYTPISLFRRTDLSYSILLHPAITSISNLIRQFYSPPLLKC